MSGVYVRLWRTAQHTSVTCWTLIKAAATGSLQRLVTGHSGQSVAVGARRRPSKPHWRRRSAFASSPFTLERSDNCWISDANVWLTSKSVQLPGAWTEQSCRCVMQSQCDSTDDAHSSSKISRSNKIGQGWFFKKGGPMTSVSYLSQWDSSLYKKHILLNSCM